MFTKSQSFSCSSRLLNFAILEISARGVTRRLGGLVATSVLVLIAATGAAAGTVNGALFVDLNVDGVKQQFESGAGGLPVKLMTAGGNGIVGDGDDVTVDTGPTDGFGNYSFTGVAA